MPDYLGRILIGDQQLATETGDGIITETGGPRPPRFRTPTRAAHRLNHHEHTPAQRLWQRVTGHRVGLHVWQTPEGDWQQGIPTTEDIRLAQRYYAGGKVHRISEAEADVLEAAGFTVER